MEVQHAWTADSLMTARIVCVVACKGVCVVWLPFPSLMAFAETGYQAVQEDEQNSKQGREAPPLASVGLVTMGPFSQGLETGGGGDWASLCRHGCPAQWPAKAPHPLTTPQV